MRHANCPRCRLSIRIRPGDHTPTECPRCRARANLDIPLYETARRVRHSILGPHIREPA
jgi:hypothetical protein